MKKVLILATGWSNDYWEFDKEAPYPKTKYTGLEGWDDLSKSCPLPAIGRYIKQKGNDFSLYPFVYLVIIGMRYDVNTRQPYFKFETIAKSKTESRKLEHNLPSVKRKLYSAMKYEDLIEILQNLGEQPPEKWSNLARVAEERIQWKDYIGKYLLQGRDRVLSNDEFEDRVAALLNSLSFKVSQKGHKLPGEYADGIAAFARDYAIVYDCKNTDDFIATSEDERAIRKYLEDERKIRDEDNIYCAFIAKSSKTEVKRGNFYLPMDSLLYLLYKKLVLGAEFSLSPVKKILDDFLPFNDKIIDKEWRE